ncbi:hypothetical protein [Pedobacter sp. Leaf176]|uniref:hypothetical protein n=1 Tax=Pedobacter sp. Leaf176 TaxID=1736286 RepID=UPI000B1F8024|nr:hypothetical protein [Pedobacter sp. Leaf176]
MINLSAEDYLCKMKRLNSETSNEELLDVKKGDMVTDTFSKTGLVEGIEVIEDALYRTFVFHLVTGRTITIRK